ncbi:MAG: hypothetical protein AB8C95_06605, partial [Phycisphaeraceae bacterium]
MPDQRHLYMLVAGVLLGVLLGPAVLGRVASQAYDTMFLGSGDTAELKTAQTELNRFINDEDVRQERIENIIKQAAILGQGDSAQAATDQQMTVLMNSFADEQYRLETNIDAARVPILARQQEHREKLSGMLTMMLLLIVIILAAEAILSPQREELETFKTTL